MPASPTQSSPRAKEVAPFLRSLRRMLDCESPRVLRWTADGCAFEIHDLAAMTAVVLPKYFKHRKYASFQRQLNYFSFRKWTKARAVVCTFSNAFFQRDRPQLTRQITRKRALHRRGGSKAERSASLASTDSEGHSESHSENHSDGQSDSGLEDKGDDSLDWVDALYPTLELELQSSDTKC